MNAQCRSNANWQGNTKLLARMLIDREIPNYWHENLSEGHIFHQRPPSPIIRASSSAAMSTNRLRHVTATSSPLSEPTLKIRMPAVQHATSVNVNRNATFLCPHLPTLMVAEWRYAFRKRKLRLYLMCDVNLMQLSTAKWPFVMCMRVSSISKPRMSFSVVPQIVAYRLPWGCVSDSSPRHSSIIWLTLVIFCC